MPLSQMFAAEHDALFGREQGQYGALDADGVPTADGAGEPLSSAIKKLKKMLDKQKKLHEKVKGDACRGPGGPIKNGIDA